MKKQIFTSVTFLMILCLSTQSFGQCASASNIYSFVYNGHSYEVVKENKSWTEAASCAVMRTGYLAEITDSMEQNAIFTELTANAGIAEANTMNQFGTASVWVGGSDQGTEGDWIWDGNNDSAGPQFWSGGPTGVAVGGAYTKWGTSPAEPDNSGGQDYLSFIIRTTAVNYGRWNDLNNTNNNLYYLIEYDAPLSAQNVELLQNLKVYPNPVGHTLFIENNNSAIITSIALISSIGQTVKKFEGQETSKGSLDVSDLPNGIYILNIQFDNGVLLNKKIIK